MPRFMKRRFLRTLDEWPEEGTPILVGSLDRDILYGIVSNQCVDLYTNLNDYPIDSISNGGYYAMNSYWMLDPNYEEIMWNRYEREHLYPQEVLYS